MKNNNTLLKSCIVATFTVLTSTSALAQVTSQACGPVNPVTHPVTPVQIITPSCTTSSKSYTVCVKPNITPPICITSTLDPTGIGSYDTTQLSSMNTKVADFVAAQRTYMAQIQGYNSCLKQHCAAALGATPAAGQTLPQAILAMQAECKKLVPAIPVQPTTNVPRKPERSDFPPTEDPFQAEAAYQSAMNKYRQEMAALGLPVN